MHSTYTCFLFLKFFLYLRNTFLKFEIPTIFVMTLSLFLFTSRLLYLFFYLTIRTHFKINQFRNWSTVIFCAGIYLSHLLYAVCNLYHWATPYFLESWSSFSESIYRSLYYTPNDWNKNFERIYSTVILSGFILNSFELYRK